MRKICFIASALLFFFSFSHTQNVPVGGSRVICRDAGFEITFPANLPIARRDVQKDKTITFTTADSTGTLVVAYNTIKSVMLEVRSVKNVLEETLSNYLRENTKIISSTDVRLGYFIGKSVKFKDVRDTATFYNRFDCYLYGNTILQIAFIGTNEFEINKDRITDFFNSLSLIDPQFEKKELKFTSGDNDYSVFLPKGYDKLNKLGLKKDSSFMKALTLSLIPQRALKGAVILSSKTYPDELFKDKNEFQVLEEAMIGALDLEKIVLLSRQFLVRDQYPGISFTGMTKSDNTTTYLRYEYYLKDHKLFQVGYACYSLEELNCDEVLGYFRSFELKK
jgi:hypothetical protein